MPSSMPATAGHDQKHGNEKMWVDADMSSGFRTILIGLAVVTMTLLVQGCSTQTPRTAYVETLSVPYQYSDGLGVGSGFVEGMLALPQGSEGDVATRAIIMALQSLEGSLIDPERAAGEPLVERQMWSSDRIPVGKAQIAEHNAENASKPEMALPSRIYQVQYVGQYWIDQRNLVFLISAKLFEQALATEPREYDPERYAGGFFVRQLSKLIQDNLLTAAGIP